MWTTYVLLCADGTLYIGITNNLERRLKQHRAGLASKYTRSRLPVRLLCARPCRDRSHALRVEASLKARTRSEKLNFVRQHSTE